MLTGNTGLHIEVIPSRWNATYNGSLGAKAVRNSNDMLENCSSSVGHRPRLLEAAIATGLLACCVDLVPSKAEGPVLAFPINTRPTLQSISTPFFPCTPLLLLLTSHCTSPKHVSYV